MYLYLIAPVFDFYNTFFFLSFPVQTDSCTSSWPLNQSLQPKHWHKGSFVISRVLHILCSNAHGADWLRALVCSPYLENLSTALVKGKHLCFWCKKWIIIVESSKWKLLLSKTKSARRVSVGRAKLNLRFRLVISKSASSVRALRKHPLPFTQHLVSFDADIC